MGVGAIGVSPAVFEDQSAYVAAGKMQRIACGVESPRRRASRHLQPEGVRSGRSPRASDPMREGFVRVFNHGNEAGEISIAAIDDTGMRYGPVTLSLDVGETQHFNSTDLEDGNAAKGIPEGVGPGEGDWRLVLDSKLDFEVLAYVHTEDGFLTAIHDVVPLVDGTFQVAIFNPGSNPNQMSWLRLGNPHAGAALVTVVGIDDTGRAPVTKGAARVSVPAGGAVTVSSAELEAGLPFRHQDLWDHNAPGDGGASGSCKSPRMYRCW